MKRVYEWGRTGGLKKTCIAAATIGLAMGVRSASSQFNFANIPRPGFLLLGVGLFLLHYALQALGWHLILRSLGARLTLSQSSRMWCSSLMARWIPGPFVYSVARIVVAAEYGVSAGAVAFGIVLEMALVVLGAVITALVLLICSGDLKNSPVIAQLGVPGLGCFFACLLVCLQPKILHKALASRLMVGVTRKLTRRNLGLEDLVPPPFGAMAGLVTFYSLFWSFSGLILVAIAESYVPVAPHAMATCISGFAGSWFIGFLSVVTPAGLGVRELALYLMLKGSFAKPLCVGFGVLMRVEMLIAEVTIVAVSSLLAKVASSMGRRKIETAPTECPANADSYELA